MQYRYLGLPACTLYSLIFAVFIALSNPLSAQEDFSQPWRWKTLESEHFYLHFKLEDELLAQRSLNIAEQALIQVAEKFNWMPTTRINLIISNQQDEPNGYATPIPFNYIVIFSPQPSDFNELNDYDNWLKILLIHELTHTVHLDKTAGAPKVFRHIFGRNPFFFPNLMQPNFLIEGLATYIETSWDRGVGRGQSAYFDMMMRTEVERGLLNLNEAQLVPERWPLNTAYLYGVYFYQFIDDVYGPDKIEEYVEIYSRQLIPYLLYKPARAISEEDGLTALWGQYQIWLNQRFKPQIDELKAKPFSQSHAITDTAYFNGKPIADAQGNLYYAKFDPYKPTYLVKNTNGKEEELTRVHSNITIVGVNEESLWYLQSSSCQHNTKNYDLYRYDFNAWFHHNQKISTCESIIQGKLLDGTHLMAAIVEDNGRQQLITYNLKTSQRTILYHGEYNETLANPNLLADQQHIILARKFDDKTWHISQYHLPTRQFTPLIHDPVVNFHTPTLDIKNEYIYFTADQDNLLAIYQSDLNGNNQQLITRSLTGAVNPSVNPHDSSLVFQQYDELGWNIYTAAATPIPTANIQPLKRPGTGFEASWDDNFEVVAEEYDYTAINSIYPRSWWFGAYNTGITSEVGVTVTGRDSLNFHNYQLGLSWDFKNEVAAGMLSYTLYNHFTVGINRRYEFTDQNEINIAKQINDQALAYFSGYWLFDFSNITWFAGGILNYEDTYDIRNDNDSLIAQDEILTGGISLQFTGTAQTIEGISESFGRNIKVSIEHDDREVTNYGISLKDSHGALATLDWREFINIYQAHVLTLRGFVGEGEEGIEPFELGGQQSNLFSLQSPIYNREQSLRGYNDNIPELTGRKARLGSAEYRFPLLALHKGISSWPIGLHKMHGSIFYDTGAAGESNDFTYYSSSGVELTAEFDLGYAIIADVSLGFAQPLDASSNNLDKDPEFYLRLSSGF